MATTPTAPVLKRWFKDRYGIPVRVQTATKEKSFTSVRIVPEEVSNHNQIAFVYRHQFPRELGNLCMRTIYKGCPGLCAEDWGGNVSSTMIAMHPREWRELMELVEVLPVPVSAPQGSQGETCSSPNT